MHCFAQADGKHLWTEKKNATSSPVVWNNECYFSRRQEVTLAQAGKAMTQQTEELALMRGGAPGEARASRSFTGTRYRADYLDASKRKEAGAEAANTKNDEAVGFAESKGAFRSGAAANIGQATVAGVWSYQGSKPFISNGLLFSAMGDTVTCVDPKTEKVVWKKTLSHPDAADKELLNSVLTPPALVHDKLFLGTTYGHLVCLSVQSGEVLWDIEIGEPIQFQPAVAKGRVYVSTSTGSLYCVETGDPGDDGWLMWGGNAAHNGLLK